MIHALKVEPDSVAASSIALANSGGLDALAAHLARYPVGPDGFLFTNHAGDSIRRTRFSDVRRPAVKASGAPAGTGLHSLRHTSTPHNNPPRGVVKVVNARLGRASAAETLDTYSHLWPDSEDRARAAVDEVLGPRMSPACHAEEAGTQNPWSNGW